jgi:hypothetical protein
MLLLLATEGLSRSIMDTKRRGIISRVSIGGQLKLTYLMFMDGVLLYSNG